MSHLVGLVLLLVAAALQACTAASEWRTDSRTDGHRRVVPTGLLAGADSLVHSLTSHARYRRIVGGKEVDPGSWPWLVALGRTGTNDVKYIYCGATLYDNKHVITAQHCVSESDRLVPIPARNLHVIVGEHDLKHTEGWEQERNIQSVVSHAAYDRRTQDNDLTVLVLDPAVDLIAGRTEAVSLNTDPQCPTVGQTCYVAGWGKTAKGSRRSYVPLEAAVTVVSNEECGRLYRMTIPYGKLCAGTGDADTCTGDSGGPLVCTCGGKTVLAGVVSHGRSCGNALYPGIYSRVSEYADWIRDAAAEV